MTLPSYAAALLVPTVDEETADLLARFPASMLAGWSEDAPQRQLVDGEAAAIRFEMIQRAALAYAASPQQVRLLRAFLVSVGYDAATAAALTSAWVDVALEWYATPRLPATVATWEIPLIATSPQTIDAQSAIVLQAADGTFFKSAQSGSAVVLDVGNGFRGVVTFEARVAGTTGNVVPGSIIYVNQGPAGLRVDTNPPVAGSLLQPARDAESDEDALDRASGRWGTLSGVLTKEGWRYVMQTKEVGGVPTLTRVFVDDANPLGPGSVGIAVANATGAPTATELAAAQAQGARFTLAGVGPVGVTAAAVLTVEIVAELKTDGTNPLAAAQGASALVQLGGKVDDYLYVDAVIAALMNIAGVKNITALSLSVDVLRPAATTIVISPTVTATL